MVGIFSAVVVSQKGRNGSGLLKTGFVCPVEHIIKGIGRLLRTRIDQIRTVGVPVI